MRLFEGTYFFGAEASTDGNPDIVATGFVERASHQARQCRGYAVLMDASTFQSFIDKLTGWCRGERR